MSSSKCPNSENEHTRHANKKFSASTSLRTAQVANFSELRRNHAVPRYVPLVAFRAESVDFFFLFFCGRSEKFAAVRVRGSFVVYVARRDGREMDAPPFVSVQKYIRRENVCEERDTFAPSLRKAAQSAREHQAFPGKEKARKNLKNGRAVFLVFAYPFLLSQKKQFFTKSLLCVLQHRLQSPRCMAENQDLGKKVKRGKAKRQCNQNFTKRRRLFATDKR